MEGTQKGIFLFYFILFFYDGPIKIDAKKYK